MTQKKKTMPEVGDMVYVPGNDDRLVGGLAEVTELCGEHIIIKEHGGASYRWVNGLHYIQDKLRKRFGNSRAYKLGDPPRVF